MLTNQKEITEVMIIALESAQDEGQTMHKLISLDNQVSLGQREVNKTNDFSFYGVCFYFGSINSSRVKSITIDGSEMTVITKNSTYVFRQES